MIYEIAKPYEQNHTENANKNISSRRKSVSIKKAEQYCGKTAEKGTQNTAYAELDGIFYCVLQADNRGNTGKARRCAENITVYKRYNSIFSEMNVKMIKELVKQKTN